MLQSQIASKLQSWESRAVLLFMINSSSCDWVISWLILLWSILLLVIDSSVDLYFFDRIFFLQSMLWNWCVNKLQHVENYVLDVHILVWATIFFHQCLEINGLSSFSRETSTFSDGLWCVVYGYCPCAYYFTLCCMDPWLILRQDLIYYLLSWFLSDLMCNLLYDVLAVITFHVMLWDPLLYVAGILYFITFHHACVLFLHPFCAMLAECSPCMFLCHTNKSLIETSKLWNIS